MLITPNLTQFVAGFTSVDTMLKYLRQNLTPMQYHQLLVHLQRDFHIDELVSDGAFGLVWNDSGIIDEVTLDEAREIVPDVLNEL